MDWVLEIYRPYIGNLPLAAFTVAVVALGFVFGRLSKVSRLAPVTLPAPAPKALMRQVIAQYREAAGQLVYQQPFTDDAAAIQAIMSVREWDEKALAEYAAIGANYAEDIEVKRRHKPINGFRDIFAVPMATLRTMINLYHAGNIQMKGYQAGQIFTHEQNVRLEEQLAAHRRLEGQLLGALSSYIDTGRIISEIAEEKR